MACLLYNTGKCLRLLLFNRPNFGVHFSTCPLAGGLEGLDDAAAGAG